MSLYVSWLGPRALKTLYFYFCKVIKKINWKDFCKEFRKKLWKKIIHGTLDTWSDFWTSSCHWQNIHGMNIEIYISVILAVYDWKAVWSCLSLHSKTHFAELKFIYSEKATKFWEISTLLLSYVVPVKSKMETSQILWPSQNIWTLLILLIISTKCAIPSQCELPSDALGSIMMCDV